MVIIIWVVLCFAYVPFKLINLSFLDFFDHLPTIVFPTVIVYLAIVLLIVSLCMQVYVSWYRKRRGGLTEGDPVILIRKGPYAIVRHPSNVLGTVTFVTLPIVLSNGIPFTVLSCIGTVRYCNIDCGDVWGDLVRRKIRDFEEVGR